LSTGLICILAVILDAALGEPRRFHPIVGFGHWALEQRLNTSATTSDKSVIVVLNTTIRSGETPTIEININQTGQICLPKQYQAFYGHHVKLIVLLANSATETRVQSSLLDVLSKLDNIDAPFPDMRNAISNEP